METENNKQKNCKCDESNCAKCLSGNCKDANCLTHSNEKKFAWLKKLNNKDNK